jgi:hypothetical protein
MSHQSTETAANGTVQSRDIPIGHPTALYMTHKEAIHKSPERYKYKKSMSHTNTHEKPYFPPILCYLLAHPLLVDPGIELGGTALPRPRVRVFRPDPCSSVSPLTDRSVEPNLTLPCGPL